jgi:hypothetical protein
VVSPAGAPKPASPAMIGGRPSANLHRRNDEGGPSRLSENASSRPRIGAGRAPASQ